jgi:hypothetical protein
VYASGSQPQMNGPHFITCLVATKSRYPTFNFPLYQALASFFLSTT